MTDYEMLSKALELSRKAHDGQEDKAGEPYIFHLVMVALQCETAEEKVVALLHDSVEDNGLSFEDISAAGFSQDIIDSICLLTHDWNECGYEEYVERLAKSGNKIAINVKIADLTHNTDLSRLGGEKPYSYDKYVKALERLRDAL